MKSSALNIQYIDNIGMCMLLNLIKEIKTNFKKITKLCHTNFCQNPIPTKCYLI